MASSGLYRGRSGLWQVCVGLEVHARVLSKSKLFSNAPASFADSVGRPNELVSLVDAALPGTLPTVNEHCVRQAVLTGLALKGRVERRSLFERKHYFYCDLPLGYQITQNDHPVVTGGQIEFPRPLPVPGMGAGEAQWVGEGAEDEVGRGGGGGAAEGALGVVGGGEGEGEGVASCESGEEEESGFVTVRLKQLQLEQDSGKSIHDVDAAWTYVDLNRAGVALMEMVTLPDIRSATDAAACVKALQQVLRHVGTCDGHMEAGSLRCDVNVSLHPVVPAESGGEGGEGGEVVGRKEEEEFAVAVAGARSLYRDCASRRRGARVEVKNLNSLKAIVAAIEYEAERHIRLLEDDTHDLVKDHDDLAQEELLPRLPLHQQVSPAVRAETRSFDASAGVTRFMRRKEDAYDYRIYPEPDLPPLVLEEAWVESVRGELAQSELPRQLYERLVSEYGLPGGVVQVLMGERESGAVKYLELTVAEVVSSMVSSTVSSSTPGSAAAREPAAQQVRKVAAAKLVANWITNELFGAMASFDPQSPECSIPPTRLGALARLALPPIPTGGGEGAGGRAGGDAGEGAGAEGAGAEGAGAEGAGAEGARSSPSSSAAPRISTRVAKDVMRLMLSDPTDLRPPEDVVEERGWAQVSDQSALEALCQSVLARPESASNIQQYGEGKHRLLGYFVGQVIKESQGAANPGSVATIMKGLLPPLPDHGEAGGAGAEEEGGGGRKKKKKEKRGGSKKLTRKERRKEEEAAAGAAKAAAETGDG